jgi:CRP/FNR family transcriptional regulator
MPIELARDAARLLDLVVTTKVRLRKNESLFRAGDRFTALYAIRLGSCKTVMLTDDGHDQVTGYHMPGDVIGTDGIGNERHDCQATALEDCEVCTLPFDRIEALARSDAGFQRALHRLLSGEITRERNAVVMLGTMRAEQKLASFLLDLARRYQLRGYSSTEFVLRMTREEIGSHLGLKLETVSRLFSRFREEGIVKVEGRVVKLLDCTALQHLVTLG